MARANNVEAIKEFALSVRDKLQISVQLEVEHGLLNETEADKSIFAVCNYRFASSVKIVAFDF